jgi:hypothetical protein
MPGTGKDKVKFFIGEELTPYKQWFMRFLRVPATKKREGEFTTERGTGGSS